MHTDIDYYAPNGAPDNDRKMKEQSWLCSQAFIESLRVYPDPHVTRPIALPGESVAFSGNTQSARRPHTEHVETAMRRRLSIAPADANWLPEQLPQKWPVQIPEGTWRSVGNFRVADYNNSFHRSRSAASVSPHATPTGSTPTGGGTPMSSGRALDAAEATSPARGGMSFFNR